MCKGQIQATVRSAWHLHCSEEKRINWFILVFDLIQAFIVHFSSHPNEQRQCKKQNILMWLSRRVVVALASLRDTNHLLPLLKRNYLQMYILPEKETHIFSYAHSWTHIHCVFTITASLPTKHSPLLSC